MFDLVRCGAVETPLERSPTTGLGSLLPRSSNLLHFSPLFFLAYAGLFTGL